MGPGESLEGGTMMVVSGVMYIGRLISHEGVMEGMGRVEGERELRRVRNHCAEQGKEIRTTRRERDMGRWGMEDVRRGAQSSFPASSWLGRWLVARVSRRGIGRARGDRTRARVSSGASGPRRAGKGTTIRRVESALVLGAVKVYSCTHDLGQKRDRQKQRFQERERGRASRLAPLSLARTGKECANVSPSTPNLARRLIDGYVRPPRPPALG